MNKIDELTGYCEPDDFYLVWTVKGYYIAQFDSLSADDIVTLRAVYKLITGSMIPIKCYDVLVLKREDVFLLYRLKGD